MAASLHPLPARPVLRRGERSPLPQRCNFASEALMRLALLAGLRCPNCGHNLGFDGTRLICNNGVDCCYAWRDADAAESDVYFGLS